MHHIFVDFEMNHIAGEYQEERTFSKMEIVEIGAVMLDDQYQEISSFRSYVRQEFNDKIDKKWPMSFIPIIQRALAT